MRVPGIFWWPGVVPGGQVSSAVVANMDVLPTFARLAGAEVPSDRTIDGRDLWPLLSGETEESPHQRFYYFHGRQASSHANIQAVRDGKWKLHVRRDSETDALEPGELYDLHEDVAEKFDRSELFPEVVERLLRATEDFVEGLEEDRRPLGRT